MSNAPHLLPGSRAGYLYGDAALIDSAANDGLTDAFDHEVMGLATDRAYDALGIPRADQDKAAADSHRRAAAAQSGGLFGVGDHSGQGTAAPWGAELAGTDEGVRPDSTAATLETLRPAFSPTGTVTAGNASPLNDGAAAVVLTTRGYAETHGLEVLAV